MEYPDIINYWKKGSLEDLETAQELYQIKKYHHCLFFLHLAIEKILKGIYVKTNNKSPLLIHNLARLTEQCNIKLNKNTRKELNEITTFNISARYDDYKFKFYKKATKEFAEEWLKVGTKLYETFSRRLEETV